MTTQVAAKNASLGHRLPCLQLPGLQLPQMLCAVVDSAGSGASSQTMPSQAAMFRTVGAAGA